MDNPIIIRLSLQILSIYVDIFLGKILGIIFMFSRVLVIIFLFAFSVSSYADEMPKSEWHEQLVSRANKEMLNDVLSGQLYINTQDQQGATALVHAATLGDGRSVKKLIKMGIDINKPKKNGSTALLAAAQTGRDLIVLDLLNAGADPNVTAKLSNGSTTSALKQAINFGYPKCLLNLLKHGANPNASFVMSNGRSIPIIHTAMLVKSPNAHIIKLLLDNGADPMIKAYDGTDVLENSIRMLEYQVAELLILHGAGDNLSKDKIYSLLVHLVANSSAFLKKQNIFEKLSLDQQKSLSNIITYFGKKNLLSKKSKEALLTRGVNDDYINIVKTTLIFINNNDVESIDLSEYAEYIKSSRMKKLFAKYNVEQDLDSFSKAVSIGNVSEINKLLPKYGANHRSKQINRSVLQIAVLYNQINSFKLLVKNGANLVVGPDASGQYSTIVSTIIAHSDKPHEFFKAVPKSVYQKMSRLELTMAYNNGHSIFKEMLTRGANPDAYGQDSSLLEYVYIMERSKSKDLPSTSENLKILLDYGANASALSTEGDYFYTPDVKTKSVIHIYLSDLIESTQPINQKDIALLNRLIQNAKNINVQDSGGNTPLHYIQASINEAEIAGIEKPLLYLLEQKIMSKGPSQNIANSKGLSVADLKRQLNNYHTYGSIYSPEESAQNESGFNWMKAAALTVGFVASNGLKLDSKAQTEAISGIIKDSMPGSTGISNTIGAINSATQRYKANNARRNNQSSTSSKTIFNSTSRIDKFDRAMSGNRQRTSHAARAQAKNERACNVTIDAHTWCLSYCGDQGISTTHMPGQKSQGDALKRCRSSCVSGAYNQYRVENGCDAISPKSSGTKRNRAVVN